VTEYYRGNDIASLELFLMGPYHMKDLRLIELANGEIGVIARRSNFPDGPYKHLDLVDVIFSGGLVRKKGGLADLFVGASDAEAYVIEIPDPFLEYEAL
jgi:hypothetical protein